MRGAASLFTPALIVAYRAAGLSVNNDAARYTLLPEPWLPPTPVDDAAFLAAWRELDRGSLVWLVVGIARFAGLRRDEISALQRHWIVERNGAVFIELRDRPDEKWWSKTGKRAYAGTVST